MTVPLVVLLVSEYLTAGCHSLGEAVLFEDSPLYSAPSVDSETLAWYPAGTSILVTGVMPSNFENVGGVEAEWYGVSTTGAGAAEGFLHGSVIALASCSDPAGSGIFLYGLTGFDEDRRRLTGELRWIENGGITAYLPVEPVYSVMTRGERCFDYEVRLEEIDAGGLSGVSRLLRLDFPYHGCSFPSVEQVIAVTDDGRLVAGPVARSISSCDAGESLVSRLTIPAESGCDDLLTLAETRETDLYGEQPSTGIRFMIKDFVWGDGRFSARDSCLLDIDPGSVRLVGGDLLEDFWSFEVDGFPGSLLIDGVGPLSAIPLCGGLCKGSSVACLLAAGMGEQWVILDTLSIPSDINRVKFECSWRDGMLEVFPNGQMLDSVTVHRWRRASGFSFEYAGTEIVAAGDRAYAVMDSLLAAGDIASATDELNFILMAHSGERSHGMIAAAFLEASAAACGSSEIQIGESFTGLNIQPLIEAERAFALLGMDERWYVELPVRGMLSECGFIGSIPPSRLAELLTVFLQAASDSFEIELQEQIQEALDALETSH